MHLSGWSQPVNCINIEGHIALLSEPTVHSLYCDPTVDLPWDIIVSHAALRNHEFEKNTVKNHIITWYKCCFFIGQFEFEV
jgi:hypothetical protein